MVHIKYVEGFWCLVSAAFVVEYRDFDAAFAALGIVKMREKA